MYDSDFDSVTNNLRNSANGTFVTLDDFSHVTGYEPNDTGPLYSVIGPGHG